MSDIHPHFRTIGLIIGAAMFMEQLDGTVLATALPSMARELGVTAPSLSIALTSYLISLAEMRQVHRAREDRFKPSRAPRPSVTVNPLLNEMSVSCPQPLS